MALSRFESWRPNSCKCRISVDLGMAKQGQAWPGKARHGRTWITAGPDMVRLGKEMPGKAKHGSRQGAARQGLARRDRAGHGSKQGDIRMKEIEGVNLTITSPKHYEVKVRGTDAILFNKMPDLSIPKAKKSKQEKVDRLEEEQRIWKTKAYTTPDGALFVPGENVHECLKEGAIYWNQPIPGAGKKTYTDVVKSACVVEPLDLHATVDDLIQYGRAVNGTPTKARPSKVYTIRPLLRPWGGEFKIHVFDARLDLSILKTVASYAGLFRGLCDWRPTFGRFEVVGVREL